MHPSVERVAGVFVYSSHVRLECGDGLSVCWERLAVARRATADFTVQEMHEKPIGSLSFLDVLLGDI